MSRANYTNEEFDWAWVCWRGAVASAIRGARGQALLRSLLNALDDLPEKKLIAHDLENDGSVCALGALGRARGLDVEELDPEDHDRIAKIFDAAPALVREIFYENDEGGVGVETPEHRFYRVRQWVVRMITAEDNLL